MIKNDKNVIAFDWDGCLCDTQYLIVKATQESFKTPTSRCLTENEIKNIACNSHKKVFDEVSRLMGVSIPENAKTLYFENYEKLNISDLKSFDGIKEVLSELKKDYNLVIISTKPQNHLEREVKSLGFAHFFDLVLGMESMDAIVKPNPEVMNPVLEKYGKNSVVLYVGDTVSDFNFANNCNIPFLGVTWGTDSDNIRKSGCKYIDKPIQFLEVISIVNKKSN